jgi:TonB-linked SusC/RagA family outer membrane protein
MKLLFILLTAAFLQVSAKGTAQVVTYSGKNVSLEKVFAAVKKQTHYVFFYRNDDISRARPVTVNFQNAPLEKALDELFRNQPLRWSMMGNTIVVAARAPQELREDPQPALPPPTIDVSGRVTDNRGNAASGVSVQVKGTGKGTTTNADGYFQLKGINENATLVFSGVSVETLELKLNGRTEINVTLQPRVSELAEAEIVVTGYQKLDSRRSSGAFGYLGADKIAARPTVNLASAMEGMFTGMRVYDEAGSTKFNIRGLGTMTMGVSDPLIVVDGFPVGNGLSDINPNDVQSVHVLKDAAAASIWGARATNGVIVITTKKAKEGLNVSVNAFVGVRQKPDLNQANPIASSGDALEWEKYLWENDKLFSSFSISSDVDGNNNPVSLGITLLNLRDLGRISQSEFDQAWNTLKQTDYRRDVNDYLLQNAITQNYDVTISGSSARNSFVFNTRWVDEKSDYRYSWDRSLLTNFRNTYKVTPWLDAHISIMAKFGRSNNSGATLNDIKSISPYERLLNNDGSYATMVGAHYQEFVDSLGGYFPHDWNYNLLQEVRSRDLRSEQNNLRLQAGLTVKLMKGLSFDTKFQYENYKTENKNYYSPESYYVRDQRNKWVDFNEAAHQVTKMYIPAGGQLLQSFGSFRSYDWRNQLTYDGKFGDKHQLTAGVFTEIFSRITENYSAPTIYGYDPDRLTSQVPESYMIKSYWGGSNYQLGGMNSNMSYLNDRFFSVLGNLAYTYNRKYTLSGSFRIDASNLIVEDPKTRYSPFWSIGGNWKMDQEDFIRDIPAIDRLNLRLSYGHTGNVVLSTSIVPLIAVSGVYPLTGAAYASIIDYGNPNLSWERTGTLNLGVDYAFFRNKLFGSIEIYRKHGKDIVGAIDLPRVTGTTTQSFNTAEILNQGVELNVGTSLPVNKDVSWNANLNLSFNKSKVLNLMLLNYNYYAIRSPHFEEGRPVDAIYSYTYLGMDANHIPSIGGVKGAALTFNDVAPAVTDDREYMEYSGSRQPTTVLGFQTGFSAYGFDLFVIVNGEFGYVFRRPTFDYGILTNSKNSSTVHSDVAAVLTNTSTDIPGMPPPDVLNLSSWGGYAQFLNTTIEKGDNVRIKEVNLGYRLPKKWLAAAGFGSARLYFQLRDPKWLWTANDKGLDPMYIFNSRVSNSPAAVTYLRPAPSFKLGISFGF